MHCYNTLDSLEELEKKARNLTTSTKSTICAGNSIVIFTMLVLEEILEQLALNPITNLSQINEVARTIAGLNTSLQIDP